MPIEHLDVKRISLDSGVDIAKLADAVSVDKKPRVLERGGEPVAVLVSMDDLEKRGLLKPTREQTERALSAGGAWRDLDNDEFQDRVYRQRHESPPSPPVTF
jgi:hypothetical protein